MMMSLYADYERSFVPFHLKRDASGDTRSSIFGLPPVGIRPPSIDQRTQYFATLGLIENLDVSVFTTFDFQTESSQFYAFAKTYHMLDQSNPLIQFVVHEHSMQREEASTQRYAPDAHWLVFGERGIDPECLTVEGLGDPSICPDHKVGGQPFFSQLEGDVGRSIELLRNGYVHLLQLSMPSAVTDELVNVDWPFAESAFHVFAKTSGGEFEFRYIWG